MNIIVRSSSRRFNGVHPLAASSVYRELGSRK
jgi:hypothetical protein